MRGRIETLIFRGFLVVFFFLFFFALEKLLFLLDLSKQTKRFLCCLFDFLFICHIMLSSFLVGGGRALLRAQGMGVGGPLRFSSVHLDYKSFLNRKEEMEQNVKNRRTGGDVGLVCDLYKQIGKETAALNQLRSEKASLAKKVGKELSVEDMRAEGMRVKEEIKVKGEKLEELQHLLYHHGGILPNWCHESCPIGPSDNNRVIGYFGSSSPSSSSSSSSPSPSSSSTDSFTAPKLAPLSPTPGKEESADSVVDYMEIGRRLDLFDFTSAAKVSGLIST